MMESLAQLGYSFNKGSFKLSSSTHAQRISFEPIAEYKVRGKPTQSRLTPPLQPNQKQSVNENLSLLTVSHYLDLEHQTVDPTSGL